MGTLPINQFIKTEMKKQDSYLIGLFVTLATLLVILVFFVLTMKLLGNFNNDIHEIDGLHHYWYEVKIKILELELSDNSPAVSEELSQSQKRFNAAIERILNLPTHSALRKIYPEIDNELTKLEKNWQIIRHFHAI